MIPGTLTRRPRNTSRARASVWSAERQFRFGLLEDKGKKGDGKRRWRGALQKLADDLLRYSTRWRRIVSNASPLNLVTGRV